MTPSDIKAIAIKQGLKVSKLMCVSADNNNKFYDMYQINPNEFMVIRGRVDVTEISEGPYSMSKWESTYRDKTKETKKPKPYTDVTSLFAEAKPSTPGAKINEGVSFHSKRSSNVIEFVKLLQAYANKSVKENYTVSAKNVTKKQVDEAQSVLNQISSMIKLGAPTKPINEKLLELYQIIPRKMAKVQNHLLDGDTIKTDNDLKAANRILSNEQETLDVMAGQVALEAAGDDSTDNSIQKDVLQSMGLELKEIDNREEDMIKKMLGGNSRQFKRAFRATNEASEKKHAAWMRDAKTPKTKLLWHGSRNENWWSIFQQSLKIRPTNAVLTGAMFGYGIYFADKAQKSIGYTSLSSSYWAKGNSPTALLAIYEVHVGDQYEISRWSNDHSRLDETKIKNLKKDSVWAKGGYDLRNDEFIVYNEAQCTIRYIVQIGL